MADLEGAAAHLDCVALGQIAGINRLQLAQNYDSTVEVSALRPTPVVVCSLVVGMLSLAMALLILSKVAARAQ